jgi:hypothetical protein
MKLTDVVETIDLLRKAGWTVEPPRRSRTRSSAISEPQRGGGVHARRVAVIGVGHPKMGHQSGSLLPRADSSKGVGSGRRPLRSFT